MNTVQKFEAKQLAQLQENKSIPDFGPGDTVVLTIEDDEIVVNTQVPASSSTS